MSWSNPSQQEAQEAYDAAKKKYDNAAEEYLRISKLRDQYVADAKTLFEDYNSAKDRLRDLQHLEIKLRRAARSLSSEESGVDHDILLFRVEQISFAAELKECIVCSGVKEPGFGKAVYSPYVDYDADASRAKALLGAELDRVRDLIDTLMKQVRNGSGDYQDMVKKGFSCDDEMKEHKKTMDQCAFEMEHYKKYL